MNYLSKIVILVISLCLVSCSASRLSDSKEIDQNSAGVAFTLADLLRNEPGVKVQGTGTNVSVMIRGGAGNSIATSPRPLYVINGTVIGNSYNAASNSLNINEVDKIRVKKGLSSTTLYGSQGSNGVIEIFTKINGSK